MSMITYTEARLAVLLLPLALSSAALGATPASVSLSDATAAQSLTYMPAEIAGPMLFASGLKAPTKVILTPAGKLLVAEAGDGANSGRVSIIDRAGVRRTLLDGLPAGFDRRHRPSGPSGLDLKGRTLYISIGEGDGLADVLRNGVVPVPRPSSPILSAVLSVRLAPGYEDLDEGFVLQRLDHDILAHGSDVVLRNGQGAEARVSLVTDIPNFIIDPERGILGANPFGIAHDGERLYVVDPGLNRVWTVDPSIGSVPTFAELAPVVNPPGIFPHFVNPVPTNIHKYGTSFLVSLFADYPFAMGGTEVRKLDLRGGTETSFIAGLSTAVDALAVAIAGGHTQFFVLEYSTNMKAGAPGRLLVYVSRKAAPQVLVDGLDGPMSVAVNAATGDVFVVNNRTGDIIRTQVR